VHEAIFEDVFSDNRRTGGLCHQRHVLRLHIRRESGIFPCDNICRAEFSVTVYDHAAFRGFDLHTGIAKFFDHASHVCRVRAKDLDVAVCDGPSNQECSCFNTVGDDVMRGAF
jgi:hypothetical protein